MALAVRRRHRAGGFAVPRSIWKGAISFGLVNVPVALYPATTDSDVNFDWLDKRTLDPVGYQRINKRTGRKIDKDDVVRGVEVADGEYVVLSDEEIAAAYPKTLQTIEIDRFVKADQVPFVHLERPYYLEPSGRGSERVYALLREAMVAEGVIGIARVVLRLKEHLAALVPAGPALMMSTLRWADEIRPWDELVLPSKDSGLARPKPAELQMASRLVKEMTGDWQPERYTDTFGETIKALLKKRRDAGETAQVEPQEEAPDHSANVVDLTELLKASLGGRRAAKTSTQVPARKRAAQ
jgi:DNA end-binding protein Ku